eukprot:scaffold5830_cov175-Prasinococcus_capsulatus_cf.AAC.1
MMSIAGTRASEPRGFQIDSWMTWAYLWCAWSRSLHASYGTCRRQGLDPVGEANFYSMPGDRY